MPTRQIHVAAGAIEDGQGRFLVARRPEGVHQGGLWEFPGGKLEPGEGLAEGLGRELWEELGIGVKDFRPLIRIRHNYGDRRVLLDVQRVTGYVGAPFGREGQPLAWLHPDAMDPAAFPAADVPIIAALRLPGLYLITGTDPADTSAFLARLAAALGRGVRMVQLRAHGLPATAYARLAEAACDLCEAAGAKLIVNANPHRALDLPGHGIHISSEHLWRQSSRPRGPGDWCGASCHNLDDLCRAVDLGLDYALLAPVLTTATHPAAQPLGWERFAELVDLVAIPVYALGGLRPSDLDTAIGHGAQGIAAIRGLWTP